MICLIMKCPKCQEPMRSDVEKEKYVCKVCKYEIKWSKEYEKGEVR